MTIRLSRAVMDKLGVDISVAAEPDAAPLGDWSVHLFRSQRLQYLLAVNSTSLFPVVLPGRGLTTPKSFLAAFDAALRAQHLVAGLGQGFELFLSTTEPLKPQAVAWSKALDRRVTGSMKEIIFSAQRMLEDAAWEGQPLSTEQLATELSTQILSYTGYRRFHDVQRELVTQPVNGQS